MKEGKIERTFDSKFTSEVCAPIYHHQHILQQTIVICLITVFTSTCNTSQFIGNRGVLWMAFIYIFLKVMNLLFIKTETHGNVT